ncbi:MAG: YihY/virulence factor BrkB family protein [Actinomycetota bacterium]|nr:YihY/virulence factor BrkB family protein [Actinomycetota bacterium]
MPPRLKLYLARAWALIWNSIGGISRHRGGQLAASMAYYALLSVFPTAIVLAAAAGFVLDDPAAREDAIEFLFKELPLSETDGRGDLESLVDGVTNNSGTLGLIGGVALIISASALLSATRNSIAVIFEGEYSRGILRGKGLDLLLGLGLGLLFALSFAATILTQFEPDLGGGALDAVESALTATGSLLPIALSAVVFAILYRVLPVNHPRLRDVWPGVIFATFGYEVVKRAFSLYLENFSNYSAVYGSLGAVVAFMVFVYIASIVFLLGAEMAALWPEVRAGKHDPGGDDEGPSKTFGEEVRDFLKSLVSRNPTEEHEGR